MSRNGENRLTQKWLIQLGANNACLAVLRLEHRYGRDRLEKACSMALESGVGSPRYAHIEPILKTDQDRLTERADADDDCDAGYVRGADYYGGGGR